ncbi:MAG: polysaccharide biosynthesis C-terminal domain-containing protein [Planctomycetes bacterium]|nr:polysaccharide biosynthesis C-terminal domain-containing protein [Planctomycetota bacterium]
MSPSEGTPAPGKSSALGGLVKHSLIYSLVPLLQRALNIVLVPLFTKKLNPAQWGASELLDLVVVAATQAAGMNLLAGMTRFYFDYQREEDRRRVISSAVVALGVFSWIVAGIGIVFRVEISDWLFESGDVLLAGDNLPRCIAVVLATIPLAMSSEAGFRYLQTEKRSQLYTTLRTTKSLVELFLKIAMVAYFDWGVVGMVASVFVGELITSVLLTGGILARIGPRVSWEKLRPMLVYAAPLIPVGLMQMGLHQVDRVMLRALGPAEIAMTWVGVFGLGYKVGFMVQQMGMGSFMQAWQPSLFAVVDRDERARLQSRVDAYAMLFVGATSLVPILYAREVTQWLSGQVAYLDAYRVLPWVAAAYVFYGLYALAQVTLLAEKRTWPLFWLNAGALALNVGLDWIWIPRWGYVGPAAAKLVTFAVLAFVCVGVANKRGGVATEWGRILKVLAVVVVALGASVLYETRFAAEFSVGVTQLLKGAALSAMLAFLWFAVLTREERSGFGARLERLPVVGGLLGRSKRP